MKIRNVYLFYFVAQMKLNDGSTRIFSFDCTCGHKTPSWDDLMSVKQELIKKENLDIDPMNIVITFYTPLGKENMTRWCKVPDIIKGIDEAIKVTDNADMRKGMEYIKALFTQEGEQK